MQERRVVATAAVGADVVVRELYTWPCGRSPTVGEPFGDRRAPVGDGPGSIPRVASGAGLPSCRRCPREAVSQIRLAWARHDWGDPDQRAVRVALHLGRGVCANPRPSAQAAHRRRAPSPCRRSRPGAGPRAARSARGSVPCVVPSRGRAPTLRSGRRREAARRSQGATVTSAIVQTTRTRTARPPRRRTVRTVRRQQARPPRRRPRPRPAELVLQRQDQDAGCRPEPGRRDQHDEGGGCDHPRVVHPAPEEPRDHGAGTVGGAHLGPGSALHRMERRAVPTAPRWPIPTHQPSTQPHRRLAVDLFTTRGHCCASERTPAQDVEMIHSAHASRHHWGVAATPVNHARGGVAGVARLQRARSR